jgi:hypothetical protein
LDWRKISTSAGIPVVSGLVQWAAGISLPKNITISVGTGLASYSILVLAEFVYNTIHVVEKRDEGQRRLIAEKAAEIAGLTTTAANSYSDLDLARLSRLKQRGEQLLAQQISPNQSNPEARVDAWLSEHRDLRTEIVAILNKTDATVFERPAPVVTQIPGIPSAVSPRHTVGRSQLLNDLNCVAEILKRDGPKT